MKNQMNELKNNKGRTKCQIFSRVVGYLSPTSQWNEGILGSFKDRKTFKVNKMAQIKGS